MGRIVNLLNKAQADALFMENAVAMSGQDVIFDYKAAELFGAEVCAWAEKCMCHKGFIEGGADWNSWGECRFRYFTKWGFNKLVIQHNYQLGRVEYEASEGGKIWDALWKARSDALEAADREDERKRAERKAKREAARKAKLEAAQAAQDSNAQA